MIYDLSKSKETSKDDCEVCQEFPDYYHMIEPDGAIVHYTAKQLDEMAIEV